MPDTLIDGNFLEAEAVGAPRYEYPFRKNGDRVTALFEQDYWQRSATFTPQELATRHPELADFYLIAESPPAPIFADLLRFTRTYARIPTRQTEWSSFIVPLPDPAGSGGQEGYFARVGQNIDVAPRCYLFPNYLFGGGAFYRPIKNSPSHVAGLGGNAITWSVPNHSFDNTKEVLHLQDGTALFGGVLIIPPGTGATTWQYVNANAINVTYAANFNYGTPVHAFSQYNRASFGTGSRYLRCRRITDFYLPGVSPGIATEADIPLPADQSGSVEFIEALLQGTGDVNVQVGELTRWRDSPIYQITKTVIDVLDLI